MIIRPFSESDREEVIGLWHSCGLTRAWNDPDRDIDRKLTTQPELFLVGVFAGEIVASAMAGYDGHRGSVYYLAVAQGFQGRGYGRLLMQEIEHRLEALGCPKINLMVRTGNEAVLGFYRALGYDTSDVVCLGRRLIADE